MRGKHFFLMLVHRQACEVKGCIVGYHSCSIRPPNLGADKDSQGDAQLMRLFSLQACSSLLHDRIIQILVLSILPKLSDPLQVLSKLQEASAGHQKIRPLVITVHARDQPQALQLQPILEGQAGYAGRVPDPRSRHVSLRDQSKPRPRRLRPGRRLQSLRRHGRRSL